jgi:hypothetical protein
MSHIGIHAGHQVMAVEANTQNYKKVSDPSSNKCQYFCIYEYVCFVIRIVWGCRTGLDPQSPRHLAWLSSALFLRSVWDSYVREIIAAATSADKHWHLHRSDCRNARIYAHKISLNVMNCDISVDSLDLPAPEAGDFEELLLTHKTAHLRQTYHLSSINHTVALLKAIMCDSARLFFFNTWLTCVSVSLQLLPSFARDCFCSNRGYILCISLT